MFSGCLSRPRVYKKEFIGLGTFVQVTVKDRKLFSIARRILAQADKDFNNYDSSSQISQINRTAAIKPARAGRDMIKILLACKKYYYLSNGLFDPSAGKLFELWKSFIKHKNPRLMPSKEKIDEAKKNRGMDKIEIDPAGSTVFFKSKGIKLDLGSAAKGFVVDKIRKAFVKQGAKYFLIDAGGEIYAASSGRRTWRIGIRNPYSAGIIKTLVLKNQAVATSGSYEQFFRVGNKVYSHIINPVSGRPAQSGVLSVSVVAKDCLTADILATLFFILGKNQAEDFIKENNLKGVKAIFYATEKTAGFKSSRY